MRGELWWVNALRFIRVFMKWILHTGSRGEVSAHGKLSLNMSFVPFLKRYRGRLRSVCVGHVFLR